MQRCCLRTLGRAVAAQESRASALQEFSKQHAPDAKALVQTSHTADQGFLFFVLPIILDSIFHKAAPWLFGPSTLRMMQLSHIRYSDVQRKKRIDRVLQVAIISAVAALMARLAWTLGRMLFRKLTTAFC